MRKTGIPWVLVGSAVLVAFAYSHLHLPKLSLQSAVDETQEPETKQPEAQESSKMVRFVGPLANYVERHTTSQAADAQARSPKPHPSDHIADSPVGTSRSILHKTFAIRANEDFSFEIPAHATNPQLHGSYRSFAQAAEGKVSDESADVELLLLNEHQYRALGAGRPSDVLFSAEASDSQDVNFTLPASSDRPVKYYLVFRNDADGAAKKVIQADFVVDL
jgi:hypothetical protein